MSCEIKRDGCIYPAARFVLVYIMADMGRVVVQTITSTLCEQFGPAIREPQSILTNPHHQLGTQMVGAPSIGKPRLMVALSQ